MSDRGPWTGHLTKPAQEPAVTVERIERDGVTVSGVFKVSVDTAWREQPLPETLEAEIADLLYQDRSHIRKMQSHGGDACEVWPMSQCFEPS